MINKLVLCSLCLIFVFSCDSVVLPPSEGCESMKPTYSTNVKAIIDQSCAYSSCHDGSGGLGPGDYKTYNGLLTSIQNGNFTDRVINDKDNPSRGMPPDASVYPESLQDNLSDIQFEIIKCWIENGFPN
jgi:hypothetical protein